MQGLRRILDASANRAREGLRVMEDLARFSLNDAALSERLKTLRHDLVGALAAGLSEAGLTSLDLLAARDTPGDVGTTISTPGESVRESQTAIAMAAASRLAEALRSVEESFKALGAPRAARQIESARYLSYTLQAEMVLRLSRQTRQWRLCLVLSAELCPRNDWELVARSALDAGVDCIQLREKSLPHREVLDRARTLVAMAAATGADVIINDRADIAMLAGARGVHLGQDDLPISEVRRLVGPRMIIGASTSTLEQARTAVGDGADYCGVGPMFPSTTKAKPRLSGPEYLSAYLADPATRALPHLAISGITPGNVRTLADLGCRGVAVSSGVCSAADPGAACRALIQALGHSPAVPGNPQSACPS